MKSKQQIRERIKTLRLAIEDSVGRVQSNQGSNPEYITQQKGKQVKWASEIDVLEWVLEAPITSVPQHRRALA